VCHTIEPILSMLPYSHAAVDPDLAVVTALQPLLAAIETSAGWRPDPADAEIFGWGPWAIRPDLHSASATEVDGPQIAGPLTSRETEVLSLVAAGLTATANLRYGSELS
jgi:DNA-binding NarL/FixJ family response regulator